MQYCVKSHDNYHVLLYEIVLHLLIKTPTCILNQILDLRLVIQVAFLQMG